MSSSSYQKKQTHGILVFRRPPVTWWDKGLAMKAPARRRIDPNVYIKCPGGISSFLECYFVYFVPG